MHVGNELLEQIKDGNKKISYLLKSHGMLILEQRVKQFSKVKMIKVSSSSLSRPARLTCVDKDVFFEVGVLVEFFGTELARKRPDAGVDESVSCKRAGSSELLTAL